MSDALYLNCLIEGADATFPVTALFNDVVANLKDKIKEKCAVTLEGVDAFNLALWKLKDSNPIAAEPEDSLVERIGSLGHDYSKFADRLDSVKRVLNIFPKQPSRAKIHIIVKHSRTPTISPSGSNKSNARFVPSTGERRADQKLPSDHALHELWMLARDSPERLLETRPVQRDESCPSRETVLPSDCRVLKVGGWLRKLQPDCRSTGVLIRNEYAEALRDIIKWLSPQDEVTEDAMEVDDENPFLRLSRGFVPDPWVFILLGDPGIGKTVFLYVLLVLRLQARLPTIYQSRPSHLFYFADDGVYRISLIPSPPDGPSQFHESTWCLIDSNEMLRTVPEFVQDLDLFIVQASSPRPVRYKWAAKTSRQVFHYFMKPWSLSELLVGRVLQNKVHSEAQIEYFSDHYGYQARSVYANASQPSRYETLLLQKMTKISFEDMSKLFRDALPLDLDGNVSYQLVTMSPGDTRESFQSTFPTRYIYEKFRDRVSTHKLEAAARLYDFLVRNPETRVPAGFMLEDAVNDVFFRGGEWSLVPMIRSRRSDTKYTHWKNPDDSETSEYLHLGYLGDHISIDTTSHPNGTVYEPLPLIPFLPGDQVKLVNGYYSPSSRFQETFDAFIYEAVIKTATIFQVATSTSHSVKEGGIKWLQGLGVEKFRYIAVTTPHTSIDFPFLNKWNTPTLIAEKYILTVDRLPEH